MTIQTLTLENHSIVLNNNKLVSVTSVITGRFVNHSIGYMLLAAKARIDANNEILERLSNQAYVLNKNTAITAFSDIALVKDCLSSLFRFVYNVIMTLLNLFLRCLFAIKRIVKKHSLDIIEYVLDVNTIDVLLMLSCIVLFVLIVF